MERKEWIGTDGPGLGTVAGKKYLNERKMTMMMRLEERKEKETVEGRSGYC